MSLVAALEQNGLDRATAETVATMAASKPLDEAQQLLDSMLGNSPIVSQYISERRKTELTKLKVKEDTHNGVLQNGKITDGVTRSGITVRSEPSKAKASRSAISNNDKIDLVKDLDAALQSLSVSRPDRKPCDCLGAKHGLLEMAPNCLNCGRIVCNKEGIGPCLFCDQPLIPNEQIAQVLEILESQKLGLMSTMSRKALASAGLSSAKVNAQSSEKATAHMDRLLGYQSEDAVRTRIIDQAGEVDLPNMGLNRWASPQEQAEQLRRQQQQLRRLEFDRKQRSGLGRKVLSINLDGKKIYGNVEDAEYESDEEVEEPVSAEPIESDDTKTVQFYDPKVFEKGVKFDNRDLALDKSLSSKPQSDPHEPRVVSNIVRNGDEDYIY